MSEAEIWDRDEDGVGVFLSGAGLQKAREIFEATRKLERGAPSQAFNQHHIGCLFEPHWTSFDDLYLAFYVLNLLGGGGPYTRDAPEAAGVVPCLRLRAMLDLPFPKVDVTTSFWDSLVSEFSVASVINFRNQLERLVPYRVILTGVDLGCVFLEFTVYAREMNGRDVRDPTVGIPRFNKAIVESDRTWNDLKTRFRVVAGFELLPA